MFRLMKAFPVLFLGMISASTLCFGQTGRAELFGTIHDPSGLPVHKAKVVAEDQATMARYEGSSDERGEYHLLGLPTGQYVLTIEQPGFRQYRRSGITLRLGDRTTVDIHLEIGQVSQVCSALAPSLSNSGDGRHFLN